MAQHHTLPLQLGEETEKQLLRQYNAFVHQLENGRPLQPQLLGELRAAMRAGLEAQPGLPEWRADAQLNHHLLHLTHPSNELLNLPWRLAVEDAPFLYLTKGLPIAGALPAYAPANALPLKVLVMIASPEDDSARLSYEEEEDQVIRAFQPLYEHGQVQIDFTEDGSLQGLKRKLKENHYHILHFSGHGIFKAGEGRLQLEDEISMRKVQVSGLEFAQALNAHPEHRPALLLLSSCQTAQGTTTDEFKGIANQLLQAGVPAVVAMGLSVLDYFATAFAGYFYRQLAEKEPLHRAFRAAVEFIRQEEARLLPNAAPGQWMIPQLYCSQRCEQVVDWERPFTPLRFSNLKFITGQDRLLLERHVGYQFLGRRRERRLALKPLLDKQPVLLRGQGGVGKTAMAEHLVQRLMLHDGRAYPFVFNETSTSITGVLDALKNYLRTEHKRFLIDSEVEKASDKAMEQFLFLLGEVGKACQPVFVFDNLESFQEEPGGPFAGQYADIRELIGFLYQNKPYPLLLTGRYPLADFPEAVPVDMNTVRFADFWKKCQQLSISQLQKQLPQQKKAEQLSFRQVAEQLHRAFGGNYRALEFFDKLYRANESEALASMDKLQEYIGTYSGEVLNQMSENLVFGQLLALLDEPQRRCLGLLAQYRRPVLPLAVEVQEELPNLDGHLERLVALTLLERQREPLDRDSELVYYYVSPIVRTLLEQTKAALPDFSHRRAGNYYYHIAENVDHGYDSLEEAYHHYYLAESKEKVSDIGTRLCNFYYGLSLFQMSFFYGQRTEDLVGEQIKVELLTRMGQVFQLYGKLDLALTYFNKVQNKAEEEKDLQWQGTTLNNISQIYAARGDYGRALEYLERSLKIRQEIGDRSGMCATLHNMAGIAFQDKKIEQFFKYEMKAYKIAMEIKDATALFHIGRDLGAILCQAGQKEEGLPMLQRSYEIGRQSGMQGTEQIAQLIQQYSQND